MIRRNVLTTSVRALAEVAHYKLDYGAPASLADIAYELGATREFDRKILRIIARHERQASEALDGLQGMRLVRKVSGGFEPTAAGFVQIRGLCRRLAQTRTPRANRFFEELECKEALGTG